MSGIRIVNTYADQEMVYTPTERPGVHTVSVQVTDDEGVPRSDVTLLHMSGSSGELYLFPVLIAGIREAFPAIIALLQKMILFTHVNGGAFDVQKFIDAEYTALHKPAPSPIIPTPLPVPASGLTEAIAQVQIEAYARRRNIGSMMGGVFKRLDLPGAFLANYTGGGDTKGVCLVVCTGQKDSTFLVRNDFFAQYSGDNINNRGKLGAPIEDERGTSEGAEQKFQRGRMLWRKSTNKVEVYDLNNNRLN